MKNGTILRKARHIRHNQQNEITQQIFTIISKNLILFLFKNLLVYNLGVLWGKEVKFCTFSFMWLQLKKQTSSVFRYYAIFRGRKLSCCSTKLIYVCILLITYFSILGMIFGVPFLRYFQKLQPFVVKKFWTNFSCLVLLCIYELRNCLRFLKSYFKLEILILLSFVVSF